MRHRWPITLIFVALLLGACASPSGSAEESTAPEESTAASEEPAESAAASGPAESVTPGEGEMTSVFDLENGDCFNEVDETVVNEVEVVDCADGHTYEIYGSADYPADDGEAYVGEEELQSFVEDECIGMFDPFVGLAYSDSELFIYYLAPTEDSWGEGDREVLCALYLPDQFLQGSMEDSAR